MGVPLESPIPENLEAELRRDGLYIVFNLVREICNEYKSVLEATYSPGCVYLSHPDGSKIILQPALINIVTENYRAQFLFKLMNKSDLNISKELVVVQRPNKEIWQYSPNLEKMVWVNDPSGKSRMLTEQRREEIFGPTGQTYMLRTGSTCRVNTLHPRLIDIESTILNQPADLIEIQELIGDLAPYLLCFNNQFFELLDVEPPSASVEKPFAEFTPEELATYMLWDLGSPMFPIRCREMINNPDILSAISQKRKNLFPYILKKLHIDQVMIKRSNVPYSNTSLDSNIITLCSDLADTQNIPELEFALLCLFEFIDSDINIYTLFESGFGKVIAQAAEWRNAINADNGRPRFTWANTETSSVFSYIHLADSVIGNPRTTDTRYDPIKSTTTGCTLSRFARSAYYSPEFEATITLLKHPREADIISSLVYIGILIKQGKHGEISDDFSAGPLLALLNSAYLRQYMKVPELVPAILFLRDHFKDRVPEHSYLKLPVLLDNRFWEDQMLGQAMLDAKDTGSDSEANEIPEALYDLLETDRGMRSRVGISQMLKDTIATQQRLKGSSTSRYVQTAPVSLARGGTAQTTPLQLENFLQWITCKQFTAVKVRKLSKEITRIEREVNTILMALPEAQSTEEELSIFFGIVASTLNPYISKKLKVSGSDYKFEQTANQKTSGRLISQLIKNPAVCDLLLRSLETSPSIVLYLVSMMILDQQAPNGHILMHHIFEQLQDNRTLFGKHGKFLESIKNFLLEIKVEFHKSEAEDVHMEIARVTRRLMGSALPAGRSAIIDFFDQRWKVRITLPNGEEVEVPNFLLDPLRSVELEEYIASLDTEAEGESMSENGDTSNSRSENENYLERPTTLVAKVLWNDCIGTPSFWPHVNHASSDLPFKRTAPVSVDFNQLGTIVLQMFTYDTTIIAPSGFKIREVFCQGREVTFEVDSLDNTQQIRFADLEELASGIVLILEEINSPETKHGFEVSANPDLSQTKVIKNLALERSPHSNLINNDKYCFEINSLWDLGAEIGKLLSDTLTTETQAKVLELLNIARQSLYDILSKKHYYWLDMARMPDRDKSLPLWLDALTTKESWEYSCDLSERIFRSFLVSTGGVSATKLILKSTKLDQGLLLSKSSHAKTRVYLGKLWVDIDITLGISIDPKSTSEVESALNPHHSELNFVQMKILDKPLPINTFELEMAMLTNEIFTKADAATVEGTLKKALTTLNLGDIHGNDLFKIKNIFNFLKACAKENLNENQIAYILMDLSRNRDDYAQEKCLTATTIELLQKLGYPKHLDEPPQSHAEVISDLYRTLFETGWTAPTETHLDGLIGLSKKRSNLMPTSPKHQDALREKTRLRALIKKSLGYLNQVKANLSQ